MTSVPGLDAYVTYVRVVTYVLVLNVYALICAWSGCIRDNTWLDRLNVITRDWIDCICYTWLD